MKSTRIQYAIIFFLSLYFVYFNGGIVPRTLFRFLLILPFVSLVHLIIVFFTFKYVEKIEKRYFVKGEMIYYKLEFANEIFIPYPYVAVYLYTPETFILGKEEKINFSILSGNSKNISYDIQCKYRGRYNIGITKIEFYDILNIFKLVYRPIERKSVVVYPSVVNYCDDASENMSLSEVKTSYFNRYKGDESISKIRSYVYGDSIKHIHWKLSCKNDELMVIDKEISTDRHILLALNLFSNDRDIKEELLFEDLLIEKLVSIANYFLKNQIPIEFVYFSDGMKKWRGKYINDFYDLYSILAEISFNQKKGIEYLFDLLPENEIKNKTIFVFSIELYDKLFRNMTKLKNLEDDVRFFYCSLISGTKEIDSIKYQKALDKSGIKGKKLYIETRDNDKLISNQ